MKVLGRQEVWIHTHFFTDAKVLDLKQRQRIQWEMEGFLRGLGIVYGVHFREGEGITVVLECIPEREKLDRIQDKLKELMDEIRPKPKVTKIEVEDEGRGREAGRGDS